MNTIFQYFQEITQIPHCSYHAEKLQAYIVDFARRTGFAVQTDEVGNILVKKGSPKLCLQAHYDMVCIGDAPKIEMVEKDGWLQAKNASLGADNGMAVAMMLALMKEGRECEYLFTADEEVGLIGANALSFDLNAKYMLNLDSEDEAEVYIGCAGGADLFASKSYSTITKETSFYKVVVSGLPGGHSGVDIDKNIPNAIKLFSNFAHENNLEIVSVKGGERINSIPTHVEAIVAAAMPPQNVSHIEVTALDERYPIVKEGEEVLQLLHEIPHGVLSWNENLQIPDISANLAKMELENGMCKIAVSVRAMDAEGLARVQKEISELFTSYGFDVKSDGKYPAWKPEVNDFSKLVCQKVAKVFGKCDFKAIHAGLECAVISDIYPDLEIASIGPNIRFPHSVHEKVELASVEKTYKVVQEVIDALS